MDILTLNKSMTCPASDIKIVGHILDSGVNPVGILAKRLEIVRYADTKGDTRALSGGKAYDYTDEHGLVGHGTGVAYLMCHDIPQMRIRSYKTAIPIVGAINKALSAVLEYVKAHPEEKHMVNMSLSMDGNQTDSYIQEMHGLIRSLVALNVPVVVAAGNDGGKRLDKYPSCFQEVITVSAVYSDGRSCEFTTWHDEVDFAEVGASVPRLTCTGEMKNGSGTSFSSPIVCNKLAKIWCGNPSLTEPELYAAALGTNGDTTQNGGAGYQGVIWIRIPAFGKIN